MNRLLLCLGLALTAITTGCGGGLPPCNLSTCPSGCCDASGLCQQPSATSCGTSGATCSICSVGQSCVAGVCAGNGFGAGAFGGSGAGGGGATSNAGGSSGGGGGSASGPSCEQVCTVLEACGIPRSTCAAGCPTLSAACRQCTLGGCSANCEAVCSQGGSGGGGAMTMPDQTMEVRHGDACDGTRTTCLGRTSQSVTPLRCTYSIRPDGSAIGTWSSNPVCRVTCNFDTDCASATNGMQTACCPLRESGGTKVCVPTFECNAQNSYSQCKGRSVQCRTDLECCSKRCSATFGSCE